jgi:TolB-like protein/DNA-binding winged helix-turn-helix (wHTH) protein
LTTLTIGQWTVRPSLNVIEREGASIKLAPRAMDLLVYLANAGDRVVSVDEMLRNVWHGRVFGDGVVYTKINQLRNALGDDPRGGRFIETVSKRGYRLVAPVAEHREVAPDAAPVPPGTRSPWRIAKDGLQAGEAIRVAVLPFASINGPEDDYFCDGLAEELLDRLSHVALLSVAPRTSSFYFKGRAEPLKTIGALLGVQYVINGSVRRAGDRLRVTVRLDDATRNSNVWSEQFERGTDEIFTVQDEIALAVVEHLHVTLQDDVHSALTYRATHDPVAQDLYYRAKHLAQCFEIEAVDRAIVYYRRAIEIDPKYVNAYVALAEALIVVRQQVAEVHPSDPSFEEARLLLAKALELAPDSADAHALLGQLLWRRFDWAGVERELRMVERAHPNASSVMFSRFVYYITCGWPPERILHYAQRIVAMEPLNPYLSQMPCIAYWHLHDFDTALVEIDDVIRRFPRSWHAHWSRWWTLDALGRYEDALEEAKRAVTLQDYGDPRSFLGVAHARVGDLESAQAIFDELNRRSGKYWSQTFRAILLLVLKDRDGALSALEQAYRDRDWQLAPALHYTILVPLHGEARFERLVDLLEQRPRVERLRGLLHARMRRAN